MFIHLILMLLDFVASGKYQTTIKFVKVLWKEINFLNFHYIKRKIPK